MKNIFKIVKTDVTNIFKNPAAIIVIAALAALPSLYAWLNIAASWDPYSNTRGVSVAVVSTDVGAEVDGKDINIGNEIISNLSKNDQLGWRFVTEDEAIEGVKHGDYYAAIIIPEDFSDNLSSVITDDIEKPSLDYYINEKVNAISPKVAGSGASAVVENIQSHFVEEVNRTVLTAFNDLGISLEDNYDSIEKVRDAVFDLEKELPEIESLMITADRDLDRAKSAVGRAGETVDRIGEIQEDAKESNERLRERIQDSEKSVNETLDKIGDRFEKVGDSFGKLPETTQKVRDKEESLDRVIDSLEKQKDRIDDGKDRLDDFIQFLEDTDESLKEKERLNQLMDRLDEHYDDLYDLEIQLDDYADDLRNGKLLDLTSVQALRDSMEAFDKAIDSIADSIEERLFDIVDLRIEILEELETTYEDLEEWSSLEPTNQRDEEEVVLPGEGIIDPLAVAIEREYIPTLERWKTDLPTFAERMQLSSELRNRTIEANRVQVELDRRILEMKRYERTIGKKKFPIDNLEKRSDDMTKIISQLRDIRGLVVVMRIKEEKQDVKTSAVKAATDDSTKEEPSNDDDSKVEDDKESTPPTTENGSGEDENESSKDETDESTNKEDGESGEGSDQPEAPGGESPGESGNDKPGESKPGESGDDKPGESGGNGSGGGTTEKPEKPEKPNRPGIELPSILPKPDDVIQQLEKVRRDVATFNETVRGDMMKYNKGSDQTNLGEYQLQQAMKEMKKSLEDDKRKIKNDLNSLRDLSLKNLDVVQAIEDSLGNPEKLISVIEMMRDRVAKTKDGVEGLQDSIQETMDWIDDIEFFDKEVERAQRVQRDLDDFKDSIDDSIVRLNDSRRSIGDSLNDIDERALEIEDSLYDSAKYVRNDLKDSFASTFDSALKGVDRLDKVANRIGDSVPKMKETLDKIDEAVGTGREKLDIVEEHFPDAKEATLEIADKIRDLEKEGNLDDLIDFLQNDPARVSEFFAQPVTLDEHQLYPIPTYGSAMNPFYTTLALWVGGLLLVSTLKVDVDDKENYRSYEAYFGRLITFVSIGIVQAAIVTLGDIYIMGTYVVDRLWFVLLGMLISTVFITIVYTLVSIFGNTGKVMAIVLLVMQIGGSGGTFPVQMAPDFFQEIHKFLPFTHAITLLREAVGGILWGVVWKNMAYISIYFFLCIIAGVALKKFFNRSSDQFMEKAKKSKIVI